ncbi:MAG: DNA mismatch repair protein MutS, partial [Myxococcales bacterium]|nr:DNA mismatch repair protein MutS [Myxococcales bacterium]
MEQYRDAKEAFPDAILFFRLGDFYEMFNDDAVVASEALSLTLTSRNKGSEDPVPMAGVPYHSAHGYLSKLLAAGHKVAICEQMGDPKQIKGLVPRQVVRVLTPGLLTDDGQLEAKQNNYLCAIDDAGHHDGRYGFALLDLSTGELRAAVIEGGALVLAEVARADPSEALLPGDLGALRASVAMASPRTPLREDEPLDDEAVRPLLDEGVASPLYDEATAHHDPLAVRAAARALRFAGHNLPMAVLPVRRITPHTPDACMRIDEAAQAHLELVRGAGGTKQGSLLDVIDLTVTAAGGRRLRRQLLSPLLDVAAIRRRLDAVELFVSQPRVRDDLRAILKRVGDIERLTVRASLGEATPRDLGRLRDSLGAIPDALAVLGSVPALDGDASGLALDVDPCAALHGELVRALVADPPAQARDGGIFAEGFDPELDELRALRQGGTELLAEHEARLRNETGIGSLKVRYTRAFGWYIEVTRTHLDKVPERWRRRQTLTNAERYLDDELEDLADKLSHGEERFALREAELFEALVARVAQDDEGLKTLAAVVAQWDVAATLAEVAHRHDYVRPQVDEGDVLALEDARHPVVERYVARGQFVPNDTLLDLGGERLWLVTGPNMAGKSTFLRQVALITLMAQIGSFVPAERAHVGVVDRIFTRIGASDDL